MDRKKKVVVVLLIVLVVMTVLNLYLYVECMVMKAEIGAGLENVRLKVRLGGASKGRIMPSEGRKKVEERKERKEKEKPSASGAVKPM